MKFLPFKVESDFIRVFLLFWASILIQCAIVSAQQLSNPFPNALNHNQFGQGDSGTCATVSTLDNFAQSTLYVNSSAVPLTRYLNYADGKLWAQLYSGGQWKCLALNSDSISNRYFGSIHLFDAQQLGYRALFNASLNARGIDETNSTQMSSPSVGAWPDTIVYQLTAAGSYSIWNGSFTENTLDLLYNKYKAGSFVFAGTKASGITSSPMFGSFNFVANHAYSIMFHATSTPPANPVTLSERASLPADVHNAYITFFNPWYISEHLTLSLSDPQAVSLALTGAIYGLQYSDVSNHQAVPLTPCGSQIVPTATQTAAVNTATSTPSRTPTRTPTRTSTATSTRTFTPQPALPTEVPTVINTQISTVTIAPTLTSTPLNTAVSATSTPTATPTNKNKRKKQLAAVYEKNGTTKINYIDPNMTNLSNGEVETLQKVASARIATAAGKIITQGQSEKKNLLLSLISLEGGKLSVSARQRVNTISNSCLYMSSIFEHYIVLAGCKLPSGQTGKGFYILDNTGKIIIKNRTINVRGLSAEAEQLEILDNSGIIRQLELPSKDIAKTLALGKIAKGAIDFASIDDSEFFNTKMYAILSYSTAFGYQTVLTDSQGLETYRISLPALNESRYYNFAYLGDGTAAIGFSNNEGVGILIVDLTGSEANQTLMFDEEARGPIYIAPRD
jgi:hypothetical protein